MAKSHDRKPCDLCGAVVARCGLKKHRNSRPCRSKQVIRQQRDCGLVPVDSLAWGKIFRWAGILYERIPAKAFPMHRSNHDLRFRRTPNADYSGPLYAGLGDVIFVESWVPLFLCISPYGLTKSNTKGLVRVLRKVNDEGPEFQQALVTTLALGGKAAGTRFLRDNGIEVGRWMSWNYKA